MFQFRVPAKVALEPGFRVVVPAVSKLPLPWMVPADQLKALATDTSPAPCRVPPVIVRLVAANVLPVF